MITNCSILYSLVFELYEKFSSVDKVVLNENVNKFLLKVLFCEIIN
jgi:hypothetical protein